ncbi:cbb3-type cytochrome oxidase subunit 1 [Chryseobacterium defluvii]|uniref:Cbb3-type cytochrome oxidase subunit 1 n=1 Tax=Chryseobacterium defluvii TaxID=160396 RepID=A0A840KHH3_9FLAO|nr:hypothetical protein [Chryseobacterium defluvii]MBB4807468.1 cbb3-type cytochrome oxidase subunit 1 [Chryseobacterium defluvii]
MKDELFNINYKRLVLWWLPTFRRKSVTLNYLWCLIFPLEALYIEFLKRRKQNLIKMNFNYQKFSMERRLNDAFDPIDRRIEIVNAVQYEGVYLYTEAEDDTYFSKTQWLYGDENPIYLRTEAELGSEYDFIVKIPNTPINMHQLRAEIDFYKLICKRYQIEIIN